MFLKNKITSFCGEKCGCGGQDDGGHHGGDGNDDGGHSGGSGNDDGGHSDGSGYRRLIRALTLIQ